MGPIYPQGGFLGSQQAWHPEKADQDNREKDPGCRTIWLEALLDQGNVESRKQGMGIGGAEGNLGLGGGNSGQGCPATYPLLPHGISSCPLPAHGENLGMSENRHDNTGPLPPRERHGQVTQQEPHYAFHLCWCSATGVGAAGQQVELGLEPGWSWPLAPGVPPRHPALASSVDTCAP